MNILQEIESRKNSKAFRGAGAQRWELFFLSGAFWCNFRGFKICGVRMACKQKFSVFWENLFWRLSICAGNKLLGGRLSGRFIEVPMLIRRAEQWQAGYGGTWPDRMTFIQSLCFKAPECSLPKFAVVCANAKAPTGRTTSAAHR